MRKIVLLCGLVLALSLPAMAQDEPRFDAFAGYSFVRFNSNVSGVGDFHSNLNGGSGSVAFYPSRRFGVVADFGGYKLSTLSGSAITAVTTLGGTPSDSIDVDGSAITYLFGPRIRFGGERVTPFAQVLFGGVHASEITTESSAFCAGAELTAPCTVLRSDNAFAMTAGGGIDVKVARHFSIRGQAEYLMTRFKESGTGAAATQNNARISVGIVIH